MEIRLCYFNQHWNIYLYTTTHEEYGAYDTWINNCEEKTIQVDTGEYRLRKYSHPAIPIHSFGFMYDEAHANQRPGHRGEWSSNSTAINRMFNTTLLEVAVDQISVAVPIEWLKELLGDRVIWETHDIYGHIITHVVGHPNKYESWVTL